MLWSQCTDGGRILQVLSVTTHQNEVPGSVAPDLCFDQRDTKWLNSSFKWSHFGQGAVYVAHPRTLASHLMAWLIT